MSRSLNGWSRQVQIRRTLAGIERKSLSPRHIPLRVFWQRRSRKTHHLRQVGSISNCSTSLVKDVRNTIATFCARLNLAYKPISFDDALYQECVDQAMRRGYETLSVQSYLRGGVVYSSTACAHLRHRPTQIWAALYTAYVLSVDDAMARFPLQRPDMYQFNKQFFQGQAQGNGVLDALTDLLHQAPDLFHPVSSNLIVTSTLNFVTASILEHETKHMKVSGAAQQYATYQRMMAAAPEAYTFMAFPRDIPVNDYIQALPEMMQFFNDTNDVLSFYKEELAGETTNQISMIATRNKMSKLDALQLLAETTVDVFERSVKILSGSSEACETFKKFAFGLVRFHISSGRYRLADLKLQ